MAMELLGDTLSLTVLAGLGAAGVLAVLIWLKNLTRKVTYLRFIVGAVSLAAIFYMFTFTELWMILVVAVVLLMSVVLGRFFCGWLCPFGFYMDLITRIRKVFRKRHLSFSEKTNTALGQFRFVIIAVFL